MPDVTRDQLIPALFLMTLVIVLIAAVFFLRRVRQSQRRSNDPDGTMATAQAVEHPPQPTHRGSDPF